LLDGDKIKDYVANSNLKGGSKKNNLLAYRLYAKWKGFDFKLPRISDTEAMLPFIPLEEELNSIISASSKKLAPFLLLLKESVARMGEIMRLEWNDIDPQSGIINIRAEKGSYNRQCKISNQLIAMLYRLPRTNN